MATFTKASSVMTLSALTLITIAGCKQEEPVSFSQSVKPIIDKYCIECHVPGSAGYEASGFSVANYEDLMKGATNGPMVIAGDSLGSNMLVLMEGRADPSISMPHNKRVGAGQGELEAIRLWIDQGAKNN